MKNFRKILLLLIFLACVALIFFCCSLCYGYVILSLNVIEAERSEGGEYNYKYVTLDSESKESNIGFVKLGRQIEGDFLSYEHENVQMMISNPELEDYSCTGSCYCDSTSGRRNSILAHTATKGITMLVAAVSSLFALQSAKEHFQNDCDKKLVCDESEGLVQSTVEECNKLDDILKSLKEKEVADLNEEGEGAEEDHYFTFKCEGHCIPRYFRDQKLFEMAHNFDCEYLENIGTVEVFCPFDTMGMAGCYKKAVKKFQETFLVKYCQNCSQQEKYKFTMPKSKKKVYRNVHICVGQSVDGENPSVTCMDETERP